MADLINTNTLNCVYFALFLLGVGYAIVIVVTGGLGGGDVPDVSVDAPQFDLGGNVDVGGADVPSAGLDAPDVSVSPLSPITIASFITTFGGIGVLLTQFFGVNAAWSLLASAIGGVLVAGLMYLFYSQVLIRQQGSSEVRADETLGLEAEVTVAIRSDQPGQVSYATKAGRMRSLARSVDNRPIARGALVRIIRVTGPVVMVAPLESDAGDGQAGAV